MNEQAKPLSEEDRVRALHAYQILDTPSERAYDDIVKLAVQVCGTTMATISLVDLDRQWFKAAINVDLHETPRDVAFCSHTILGPDVMIVGDALQDSRFSDNPLVTGEPNIRFYAGAPLRNSKGIGLGSLCVIDSEPKTLDEGQVSSLRALARLVVDQLELRRTSSELAEALERTRVLGELVPICTYCKNVRDDAAYWQGIERYMLERAGVLFSHGICPVCVSEQFPEFGAS